MRRLIRRVLWLFATAAAAVLAAVVVLVVATLPPRAGRLASTTEDGRLVWGAYHVHSSRSDGSGSVDAIARAAARAGLNFVIFTDHGDGTTLDPPQYRHGVLCIDAAEVNTEGGHLVALNLRQRSEYPLAGEARDVVEDVHRLGGWAVAAHPDSPRPALRWRAPGVLVDGFEWMNADSAWRGRPATLLAVTALRALVRPPETIASLFDTPPSFERWDGATRSGFAFSLAALDAHARIGADDGGGAGGLTIPFPGYESLFRTLATAVTLERAFTGEAIADAGLLMARLAVGQSYSIVRGFNDSLVAVTFTASAGDRHVALGGQLPAEGRVDVSAKVNAPDDAQLVLLKDGQPLKTGQGSVEVQGAAAGRYRLQVFIDGRRFPWIVTNAIVIGARAIPASEARPAAARPDIPPKGPVASPDLWQVEKDPSSTATIERTAPALRLRYTLGEGIPAGQYVAVAAPAGGESIEGIDFTARSDRPMRLSLQVRVPGRGTEGQRWRRSIYLDTAPRRVQIQLADLEPVDRRSPLRPVVATVQAVLFVIDTVNARPGTSGEVVLEEVRFVRRRAN